MRRHLCWLAAAVAAALVVPALHADVKTREKTTVKLEGTLGRMSRTFGGSSPDGVTATIALKGSRKVSMGDSAGEIVRPGCDEQTVPVAVHDVIGCCKHQRAEQSALPIPDIPADAVAQYARGALHQ